MLTLHVHDLTVMSGGGGHGGAVTGEKAAKPMATAQYGLALCVSSLYF